MTTTYTNILNGGIDPGISGSGKRAYYAMLSYNTSSTWYGFALQDANFKPVVSYFDMSGSPNYYGASNIIQNNNSTYSYGSVLYNNVTGTQSTPSSSGTSSYMNATNSIGEFGNALVDVYSDGTYGGSSRKSGSWNEKFYLNSYAINSDHANKRIVYLLIGNTFRAVDRLYGGYSYPMVGTADYTFASPTVDSNMYGTASYHAARKELTILSYSSSGGQFNVYTFQNVDFNLYPNPAVALARPEVVRVNSTVSMASNWQTNNSESYYNLKPVVTDNGKVYVAVMFTSSSFRLYEFTRSGTSAVNATNVTTQSLTTSYGKEQGLYYGQYQQTSRDGTSVCLYCPYYYYGSGVRAYMIDKTNNTYTSYGYGDSSYGHQPMPFQNNGWVFIYNGNVYSSNYSGGYVAATYERAPTGGFQQTGSTQYFTQFTGPNTTNYPGWTPVVDYDLLPNNQYGPKS